MVDAFHSSFALLPMAPAEPAPVSSPAPQNGAGYNPSKPLGSDWSAQKRDSDAKVKSDRRGAIARARAKVDLRDDVRPERRHETKADRLARPASSGKRETGSNKERRSTVDTVARALEKVNSIPDHANITDKDFRSTRDKLRQRYPGQSLAQMVETAERQEAAFKEDPVATREALIAQYARMPRENMPEYREREHEEGTRGSIRRARQDQQDAEELAAAEAKYGRGLAQILKQIESFDAGMIDDPHGTSARLATAYGAPAVAADVPAYEQRQAVKAHQNEVKRIVAENERVLYSLIGGGHIPGDADTMEEVAVLLKHPRFEWSPDDIAGTMLRACAIVAHPNHVRVTPRTKGAKTTRRDPGTMSISGGGAGAHSRGNGQRSTRDVLRAHLANA